MCLWVAELPGRSPPCLIRSSHLLPVGEIVRVTEQGTRRRHGATKYAVFSLGFLVAGLAYGAYGTVAVHYPYEREIGGHVRNAYEVNTPEAMIVELNLSVRGMRGLGLREEMYSAFFPWERTPDRSMAFQYSFIDQLINRTEAVIAWRTLAYSGNTTPETLGDVYEQKMDNLRSFMREGCEEAAVCTDWIAREVYLLYYATPFYFDGPFASGAALGVVGSATLFGMVKIDEYLIRTGRAARLGPAKDLAAIRKYLLVPAYVTCAVLMAAPFILDAVGP